MEDFFDFLELSDIAVLSLLLAIVVVCVVVLRKYFSSSPKQHSGNAFVVSPSKDDEILAGIGRHYGEEAYAEYKFPEKEMTDKEKLNQKLKSIGDEDYAEEKVEEESSEDEDAETRASTMFNSNNDYENYDDSDGIGA